MKQLLIIVLTGLLAVTGEAARAQTTEKPTILQMAPVNLGRVRSDQVTQHELSLPNPTDATPKIVNVRLLGEGIKAKLPTDVPPGETETIKVVIEPENLVGIWEWRVEVETNDSRAKLVRYTIQASVYPPIEFLPSRRIFFTLYGDQTDSKRVTIHNHSATPFSILGLERSAETFNAQVVVADGNKLAIDITVPDSAPFGRHRETLTLLTNHPERRRMSVPVHIFVKQDIYTSVEDIRFGRINLVNFQTNKSSQDLLVQTVILSSRNRAFKITAIDTALPFLKVVIDGSPAGKVYRLDFALDPLILEKGRFTDNIAIKTDDPRFPEIRVPVSGEIR